MKVFLNLVLITTKYLSRINAMAVQFDGEALG